MQVQPYLFFDGRCEEAVEFYRRALGAEVTMLMRFRDSPEPPEPGRVPPDAGDKVMHTSFRIGVLASLVAVLPGGKCHRLDEPACYAGWGFHRTPSFPRENCGR
jgi:uncharacterized glyoxalase superfamily protein PhnB